MRFLHRARAALAPTVLFLLLAPITARAAPLLDGLGGPAGYGIPRLAENDDSSSAPISLEPAFPGGVRFFGSTMYTETWVNTNGNITFAGPLSQFTPAPFPVAMRPMIAPYWGDVDIRGGVEDHDNAIYWHLSPGRMVVTWHNVGYYSIHDDRKMNFQMILTNAVACGSGDFDVEFRYDRCEWTTGDASGGSGGYGGTPAQAGFDAGNEIDFVEIPGSRTAAIADLCTTSNVGVPGVWRFAVRGGAVTCPNTGAACQANGAPGACGVGVTQCVGRDIVCTPVGTASSERCDAIDNDCNGQIDDGDLCDALEVCSNGQCVPPCFEGGCAAGYTCTPEGGCVDTACMGMTCPAGMRCSGGECRGSCDGIVCPHGQQCLMGRCADLCDVLSCAADEVCSEGRCIRTCPCTACAADEICAADGTCTPTGCDLTICEEGFYCRGGECLDACAGTSCPPGQYCTRGQCTDAPVDGTVEPPPDRMNGDDAGTPPVMNGEPDAGGGLLVDPRASSPGCACGVSRSRAPSWAWAGLLALAILVVRRKR